MNIKKFHIELPELTHEEATDLLQKAIYSLVGLSQAVDRQHTEFGSDAKQNAKYWNEKAKSLYEPFKIQKQ